MCSVAVTNGTAFLRRQVGFCINGRSGIVGQAENMEARRGKAAEADAGRRHRGYGPRGSGEGNVQRTNSTERLMCAVIPRTNLDGHCKLP